MAVITVSKIQVRSGFQEDLPSLDTGEFGWCVDTQRLFIGKGTLAEGAPTTGVTEILTEYNIQDLTFDITAITANLSTLTSNVANIQAAIGNLVPITTLLLNNQTTIVNIANVSVDNLSSKWINYTIVRSSDIRTGVIRVTNFAGNSIAFSDEYTENNDTGVRLYFTGNIANANAVLGYTTTNSGFSGNIVYSFQNLEP